VPYAFCRLSEECQRRIKLSAAAAKAPATFEDRLRLLLRERFKPLQSRRRSLRYSRMLRILCT
jgi:hypothetical protein